MTRIIAIFFTLLVVGYMLKIQWAVLVGARQAIREGQPLFTSEDWYIWLWFLFQSALNVWLIASCF